MVSSPGATIALENYSLRDTAPTALTTRHHFLALRRTVCGELHLSLIDLFHNSFTET